MAELEDKQSLQVPGEGAGAGLQFIRSQARGAENAFVKSPDWRESQRNVSKNSV